MATAKNGDGEQWRRRTVATANSGDGEWWRQRTVATANSGDGEKWRRRKVATANGGDGECLAKLIYRSCLCDIICSSRGPILSICIRLFSTAVLSVAFHSIIFSPGFFYNLYSLSESNTCCFSIERCHRSLNEKALMREKKTFGPIGVGQNIFRFSRRPPAPPQHNVNENLPVLGFLGGKIYSATQKFRCRMQQLP